MRLLTDGEELVEQVCGRDLTAYTNKDWDEAATRLAVIKPVLESGRPYKAAILRQSAVTGKKKSQIYVWIKRFEESGGDLLSLCDRKSKLPRPLRLLPRVQAIIDAIFRRYDRQTIIAWHFEIGTACDKEHLPIPCKNTVRDYYKRFEISQGKKKILEKQGRTKTADARYGSHQGRFKDFDGPWSLVQVDHTPMDLMVVDQETRQSVGRPYLTLALDVASRMILGMYISFDDPSIESVGLCLVNAMFSKAAWLQETGVRNPWPCEGVPGVLHFDNAMEFRSHAVSRACERYGIRIDHRPVGVPHFAGHIERGIGTFVRAHHGVRGSTFSNVRARDGYQSEKWAILTLRELKKYATEWVTGIYHERIHRGVGCKPLSAYARGILGTSGILGVGQRHLAADIERVRIDFMPIVHATIQRNGVTIDNLVYTGEVLSAYTGVQGPDGKGKRFLFRRDPHRINEIWFYADDADRYYRLSLNEPLREHLTLWEWREFWKGRRTEAKQDSDERSIRESFARLKEIEERAMAETTSARKTKRFRRLRERKLHGGGLLSAPTMRELDDTIYKDATPFEDEWSL